MSATPEELQALAAEVQALGHYLEVRVLPDGTVAGLHDLVHTRAIVLDCDRWGYERRFCFEDRSLATQRFAELQSADDEPRGYVARR